MARDSIAMDFNGLVVKRIFPDAVDSKSVKSVIMRHFITRIHILWQKAKSEERGPEILPFTFYRRISDHLKEPALLNLIAVVLAPFVGTPSP